MMRSAAGVRSRRRDGPAQPDDPHRRDYGRTDTIGVWFGGRRGGRWSAGSGLRVRLGCGDRTCCQDQSEVAERLWEVADLSPTAHVVLLGEQAEIVGKPDEPLEQASRVID